VWNALHKWRRECPKYKIIDRGRDYELDDVKFNNPSISQQDQSGKWQFTRRLFDNDDRPDNEYFLSIIYGVQSGYTGPDGYCAIAQFLHL